MSNQWTRKTLGSIASRIESGGTPSRNAPSCWGGAIPWVTPGELTKHSGKYIADTQEKITAAGLSSSGATLLPAESLMVTTRATLGSAALAAMPMATNQGFKSLIFSAGVDASFYYHLIGTLSGELARRASGTTFLEISAKQFASICVPVPPLQEQQKIAEILDTVDKSIRSTECLLAKLRQVRLGLLLEVFGRPTELFVLLDEVAIRGSGHTPDKLVPSYWNGGVKWVSLADSNKLDQIYIHETDKNISDLGIANSSAVKHPSGTVIVSRDAGVGKSAILADEMAVSQHFIAWKCRPGLSNMYLYYWLQYMKPRFESIAMGSTIKTIGLPYFRKLKISLPPRSKQDQDANLLLQADAAIVMQQRTLIKIRQAKQGLMEDLLTGQVRVTV